ncbi:MAG: AAA family ATPase [Polyangiales bacterium]
MSDENEPRTARGRASARRAATSSDAESALRFRVPNAPSVFVGRAAELAQLRTILERSRVAVLSGPGGIGKTSLASRFVHAHTDATRAIFVRCVRSETLTSVLDSLLTACIGRAPTVAVSTVAERFSALLTVIERDERWCIIDNCDELAPSEEAQLCALVARFVQRATVLVTSRNAPSDEQLQDAHVRLGSLSSTEIEGLLRSCAPSLDAKRIAALVERSAGSPWHARALLANPLATATRFIEPLDEPAERLLAGLISVQVPVPIERWRAWGATDATIAALARRSLVDVSDGALLLHEEARRLSGRTPDPRLALSILTPATDPQSAHALLVAHRALGSPAAELEPLLSRWTDDWLAAGMASTLFSTLSDDRSTAAIAVRIRCALWLGGAALEWARSAPTDASPALTALRARAHLAAGDYERAIDESDAALEQDPTQREAILVRCAALRLLGRLDDAERAIDEQPPGEELDVQRARCAMARGQFERATRILQQITRHTATASQARERQRLLAVLLASAGRLEELEALFAQDGEAPYDPTIADAIDLQLRASLAVERGRFDEMHRLLARLAPLAAQSIAVRCLVASVRARFAWCCEDSEAFDRERQALLEAAVEARLPMFVANAAVFDAFAALRAAEPTPLRWPEGVALAAGSDAARVAAAQRILSARHRSASDERTSSATQRAPATSADVAVIEAMAEAEEHAARRAIDAMNHSIDGGVREAQRRGARLDEIELRLRRAELRLASAPFAEVDQQTLSDLALVSERARTLRARSWEREAALLQLVADRRTDAAWLRACAEEVLIAPRAARRARAWLGLSARLDWVDRALLERVHQAAPVAPATESWTLRSEPPALIDPTGRSLSLRRHWVASALLRELASSGPVSKERLVRAAWKKDYHPLRDDNRLHVAIARLRALLSDDPRSPRKLLTQEEGYRLTIPLRLEDER